MSAATVPLQHRHFTYAGAGLNTGKLFGTVGYGKETITPDHWLHLVYPLVPHLLTPVNEEYLLGDRVQAQLPGYRKAVGLFPLLAPEEL